MRPPRETTIVAITNLRSLGEAVGRAVADAVQPPAEFVQLTYDQAGWRLTPSLLASADLFIVELLRPYVWGIRAEGVILAERLSEHGKQVLVFGPHSIARELDSPCYWDVASTRTLREHVRSVLRERQDAREELGRMRAFFRRILAIPPQHP